MGKSHQYFYGFPCGGDGLDNGDREKAGIDTPSLQQDTRNYGTHPVQHTLPGSIAILAWKRHSIRVYSNPHEQSSST